MTRSILLLFLTCIITGGFSQGTIGDVTLDDSRFYAQTKQVNQFFRRFNNEEDVEGKRLYKGDSTYRSDKNRRSYLNMIFDNSSTTIDQVLKTQFMAEVTYKKNPQFLDFHNPEWFAEVNTSFSWKGQPVDIILFMHLEKENLGHKWVISNIYFSRINDNIQKPEDTTHRRFLHPLSHELEFMNLSKVFRETDWVSAYFPKDYTPDPLTVFNYELKNGNLKFETIRSTKFHFFQIPSWYFEVSFFNRSDFNSGWLISNLARITAEEKSHLMKQYLNGK